MLMPDVERYLAIRRAAGFSYQNEEWLLRSFARFAEARCECHVIARTVILWAEQAPSQTTRARRLTTVRVFARFLYAEDQRHQIPPQGLFAGQQRRQTPYIFTDEEIELLMEHAARLGPSGSLRPYTYATLFGLLAVSGMRVGEALALRIDDFKDDYLVVRETKFHKSRLVPLHPTSVAALDAYLARRRRVADDDPHIFVSLHRRRLSYAATIRTFHKVCEAASLPRQPGSWRLRLHDLRHSLAVRVLEAAPDDRDRITQHTLALTTYMGHARVASTYWYLQSTPVLMGDIADRCEAFAGVGGTP